MPGCKAQGRKAWGKDGTGSEKWGKGARGSAGSHRAQSSDRQTQMQPNFPVADPALHHQKRSFLPCLTPITIWPLAHRPVLYQKEDPSSLELFYILLLMASPVMTP